MCKIKAAGPKYAFTQVSNRFIKDFLADADGPSVKLYLYLQFVIQNTNDNVVDFSISSLADSIDCTKNSVRKCLDYWKKTGLLSYELDESDNVSFIELTDINNIPEPKSLADSKLASEVVPQDNNEKPSYKSSNDSKVTREMLNSLMDNASFDTNKRIAEKYLGRPMNQPDLKLLGELMDIYHFEDALIWHLYEYCCETCAEKLEKSVVTKPAFIRKVATEWFENDVTTISDAEAQTQFHDTFLKKVKDALGILSEKKLSSNQVSKLSTYVRVNKLPEDVIIEACNASVGFSNPYNYMVKLVDDFVENKIKTLDEAKNHIAKHKEQSKKRHDTKAPINNSNNFDQREMTDSDVLKFREDIQKANRASGRKTFSQMREEKRNAQ